MLSLCCPLHRTQCDGAVTPGCRLSTNIQVCACNSVLGCGLGREFLLRLRTNLELGHQGDAEVSVDLKYYGFSRTHTVQYNCTGRVFERVLSELRF